MRAEDPLLIQLETARELVEPYELEDVLQQLEAIQAIGSYFVGTDYVRIVPAKERRFDLAILCVEWTEYLEKERKRSKRC